MGNFVLGYDNRADLALLTGGSWQSGFPLNRLNDYRVSLKSRTNDVLPASTKLFFQLAEPTYLGLMGLMGTNASADAAYRMRLYDSFTFSTVIYDSGIVLVYPDGTMPFGSIPWGAPTWWTAKPTSDEIARFQCNVVHMLSPGQWAQYGSIEIFDSGNLLGYFEAGRFFAGTAFQPDVNPFYGKVSRTLTSRSTVTRAKDGTPYKQIERPDFSLPFAFDRLSADEAMRVLDLQVIADIHGEVLVMEDPSDVAYSFRRQVFGRLKQLDPIQFPVLAKFATAFEVEGTL